MNIMTDLYKKYLKKYNNEVFEPNKERFLSGEVGLIRHEIWMGVKYVDENLDDVDNLPDEVLRLIEEGEQDMAECILKAMKYAYETVESEDAVKLYN